MIELAVPVSLWLASHAIQTPVSGPAVQMRLLRTSHDETPLPAGLGPHALFDAPTGQMIISQSIDEVVAVGLDQIRKLGILPAREDDDLLIDQLKARRLSGAAKRSLAKWS